MGKTRRKTPLQLAKSGGSAVARSATRRSGAGVHGGTTRQRNRRDRKAAKQALKGDY